MLRGKCCVRPTRWPRATTSPCASPAASSTPPSAARESRITLSDLPELFLFGTAGNLQDREEGFLGDVDLTNALHALLAFLLFFQELALAGDVAAVAFGDDVFADGADGLAGDHAAADGGLDGDLEH